MLVCSVNLQHCYQSCVSKLTYFLKDQSQGFFFSRKISSASHSIPISVFYESLFETQVHPKKKVHSERISPHCYQRIGFFFKRLIGRNDSISKGKGLIFKKTNPFLLLFLLQPSKGLGFWHL